MARRRSSVRTMNRSSMSPKAPRNATAGPPDRFVEATSGGVTSPDASVPQPLYPGSGRGARYRDETKLNPPLSPRRSIFGGGRG